MLLEVYGTSQHVPVYHPFHVRKMLLPLKCLHVLSYHMYEWLMLSHNEDTIHCSPPLKKTLLVTLWEADSFPRLFVVG